MVPLFVKVALLRLKRIGLVEEMVNPDGIVTFTPAPVLTFRVPPFRSNVPGVAVPKVKERVPLPAGAIVMAPPAVEMVLDKLAPPPSVIIMSKFEPEGDVIPIVEDAPETLSAVAPPEKLSRKRSDDVDTVILVLADTLTPNPTSTIPAVPGADRATVAAVAPVFKLSVVIPPPLVIRTCLSLVMVWMLMPVPDVAPAEMVPLPILICKLFVAELISIAELAPVVLMLLPLPMTKFCVCMLKLLLLFKLRLLFSTSIIVPSATDTAPPLR